MAKYDIKVRYVFEGTYAVVAEDCEKAKRMITEDCGLVMGGNIHTSLSDELVNWDFDTHPDVQILSYKVQDENEETKEYPAIDFSRRIKELRYDIIDAIRQLLYAHGKQEIKFPKDNCDSVWVIWFNILGDPFECEVIGVKVTDVGLIVSALEIDSGEIVTCYSSSDIGARNIDWLYNIYEAIKMEFEGA